MFKKYEKLRDEKGVTDYRVVKELGFHSSVFTDWKHGKAQPKIDKLIKIAKYFEVPITYFIEE